MSTVAHGDFQVHNISQNRCKPNLIEIALYCNTIDHSQCLSVFSKDESMDLAHQFDSNFDLRFAVFQ